MVPSYKDIVAQIRSLPWKRLSPAELQELMVLAAYVATEFAESLRIALALFPKDKSFAAVSRGELQVNNLQFADYRKKGDHADFLWFFLKKHGILQQCSQSVHRHAEKYLKAVRALPPEIRAMSIVSRERELPGIFKKVLEAPNWNAPGLDAFNYFLRAHISLDSDRGGHADMLMQHSVTEEVTVFYTARFNLYTAIPTLFE